MLHDAVYEVSSFERVETGCADAGFCGVQPVLGKGAEAAGSLKLEEVRTSVCDGVWEMRNGRIV